MASKRDNTKLIGGFFDPSISKAIRTIAVQEGTTQQALLAEAIDMLLRSRGKPSIAVKWNNERNPH